METRLENIIESAQDLSLEAFLASYCAAHQLGAEGSSKSVILDMEVKVAALEKEKATLQLRLEKSTAKNATLSTELVATAEQVGPAEEAAKEAKKEVEATEERRTTMRNRLHSYKEAVKAGASVLQEELPELLEKYGLMAPEMSSKE